ncbi:MAG: ABC transporter ATP-binding protein [Selenomonadaceae bacterium]|nr:ABC transporter ATP-binding protein [Selenomonadaceae bacterium]
MIELQNLVKVFKGKNYEKIAVNSLSFTAESGEIFALLGPNGAGKTTTLKMLTMALKPTSGNIFFEGQEITSAKEEIKRIIGVVPQHINFDQELTARENLRLHGRLFRMDKKEIERRAEELLKYMELTEISDRFTKTLSGGMKRRLIIARALMHRPKILFLDEPTVALDPNVRRRIWELLKNLKKEGTTIFLTTHYIEEAQILADRVAILDKGKLVALDEPKVLMDALGGYAVEWEEDIKFFKTRAEAKEFYHRLDVEEARVRKTNLEDVFLHLTSKNRTFLSFS